MAPRPPDALVPEDEQLPARCPEDSPPPLNLPPNLVVVRGGRFPAAAPPALAPPLAPPPYQPPLAPPPAASPPTNALVPVTGALVPSSANAVAPAASTPPASTNNILQTDLTALVISHLRTVGTPVYTKDMVKALGLKHKREVNPILYRLQDRGVLTKVWDTPPAWTLVPGSYGDLERNNLFAAAAAAAAAGKQQAGGQAPQREIQAPPDFGTAGDEEFAGGARPNGVGPRGGLKGPPKPRQQPLPPHELLRLSNTFAQMVMQQQGATANGGVAPAAPSAAPNLKITQSVVSSSLEVSYPTPGVTGNGDGSANNGAREESPPVAVAPAPAPAPNPPGPQSISKFPSYASLTKNPVSAFHEFGQMQHVEAKIDIVATDGPPHNPR